MSATDVLPDVCAPPDFGAAPMRRALVPAEKVSADRET